MALDRQCSIFSSGRTQGSPLQNVYRLTALPLAMGVICLFLLVSCEDTEKSGMTDKAAPGTVAAPDIALTRLDGEAFRLSDYRGKVVVLNFWATCSSGGGRVSMDNGNIQAIPTTFIIDREGKIYRKHVGYRERQHLEPELKLLLKETTETPVASL